MKWIVAILVLLALTIVSVQSPEAQEPNGGSAVIDRHLSARGGRDLLLAVRSIRMVGSDVSSDSAEPFVALWKHPNNLRMEIGRGDSSIVYAYDGKTAWTLETAPWGREPAGMTPTQKDVFSHESDFAGPFIDASAKGLEIRYQGINRDGGTPTHEFEIVARDGRIQRFYIDTATFLIRRESYDAGRADFSYRLETRYDDYRMVNDIAFPRSRERYIEGALFSRVLIDSITVDVLVADSEFSMPPASAKGDTAGIIDIDRILVLRDLFRRDSGYVRLIALMSPT